MIEVFEKYRVPYIRVKAEGITTTKFPSFFSHLHI